MIEKILENKYRNNILKRKEENKVLLKFGQRIKSLREKYSYSKATLAEKAGLHFSYIGMLERAERNPSLCSIEKIAKAFNIKISDLLELF